MSRPVAQTLSKITALLDEHSLEEKAQAMAFLAQRYGLPGVYAAANILEERRRTERERAKRYRQSRDGGPDMGAVDDRSDQPGDPGASRDTEGVRHVTETASPAPYVVSTQKKSVKKQKNPILTAEQEENAKMVLEASDFEFLMACPEPFKGAWAGHPEWWVSLRDGYAKLPIQREASKCMGWIQSKFSAGQIERLNLRDRLRMWLAKGDRWRENDEMRKAVRR